MSRAVSRRAWLRGGWLAELVQSASATAATAAEASTASAAAPRAEPQRRVAKILRAHCIASASMFCGTCVERCPVPGAMRLGGGRPVVDKALCDGCGVCQQVCPAPRLAIDLVTAP